MKNEKTMENLNEGMVVTGQKFSPKAIKFIAIGCGVLLILLIGVCLIPKSGKINPFNADVINISGVDGYGHFSFDEYALIEKAIGEEPTSISDESFEWIAKYDELVNGINCGVDKKDGLSNGDKITVSFTFAGAASEKFSDVSKIITVSGLTEVEKVDAFKDVEVTFDGMNGEGIVRIKNKNEDDEFLSRLQFRKGAGVDDGNLSNGDKIEIVVTCYEEDIETFGKAPAEKSKAVIVTGLAEYAKVEDLPLGIIKVYADQFVAEEQAENTKETNSMFSYSDAEVYGIYFCEALDGSATFNENELHILVSYIQYLYGEYHSTIYKHLVFEDIIKNADGTVDIEYEDGSGNGTFSTDVENYLNNLEEDYFVTKLD